MKNVSKIRVVFSTELSRKMTNCKIHQHRINPKSLARRREHRRPAEAMGKSDITRQKHSLSWIDEEVSKGAGSLFSLVANGSSVGRRGGRQTPRRPFLAA